MFSCFNILPGDDQASKPTPDADPSILNFLLSKIVRNKSVLYKPPSMLFFDSSIKSSKPLPLSFNECSDLTRGHLIDSFGSVSQTAFCLTSGTLRLYPGLCCWTSINYIHVHDSHPWPCDYKPPLTFQTLVANKQPVSRLHRMWDI